MKKSLIYFCLIFLQTSLYSAPESVYDKKWDEFDNSNNTSIDHSDFNTFLKKYVKTISGINLVNYQGISPTDLLALNNYIKKLEVLPILKYSKQEQLAYWINLYNALTVKVILDTQPKKSIKESYGGILNTGPWNKKLLTIEGYPISLNDIEHRILRPLWKDARIHFLVNCASIGCPNLLLEVITANNYEEKANFAAREFINSSRGVDLKHNKLTLSSIFQWYLSDFGDNTTSLLNYLNRYSDNKNIINYQGKISYQYNWNLNKQ
ncbi:MAG: DUF547 domain-containing protein [Brevinema sp.]